MKWFRQKLRVRRQRVEIGPEEIFMDAANIPGFRQETAEGRMEAPLGGVPFLIASIVIALGFAALAARLGGLSLLRGPELLARSEANRTYPVFIQPPRGVIYDRNLAELASNVPAFVISFNTTGFKSRAEAAAVLERLSRLLGLGLWEMLDRNGMSPEAFAASGEALPPELFIQSGDLREEVLAIRARPEDFSGVEIQEGGRRAYRLSNSAAHLLGFVGQPDPADLKAGLVRPSEAVGKSGVEYWYEDVLRGVHGRKILEVNAAGEALRERFLEKPRPGKSLVLEVDVRLQDFAAKTLERHLRALSKHAGALVMLDPRNGGVRALVSHPSFDPNLFGRRAGVRELAKLIEDSAKPFFNRAVSGGYPSGSTIKPILAVAALEEGIIDPARAVYDPGYLSVPNPFNPEKPTIFKDWKELGWVDMRRALALSANVYFYIIGGGYRDITGLGIERLKGWLLRFGWGQPLGIDLPGEYGGLVPDPELKKTIRPSDPLWRIGDTYITAIGQGDIQATPLQLAVSTAAIANGGTLWKPRLGRAVLGQDGRSEELPPVALARDLASTRSLGIAREGMRLAVTAGSARALDDLFFPVAGKTGTAQTGAYGKNHGWFVGFAPSENPEIVIAVLVEEGTGGTTDAVPIAKEVLYYFFTEISRTQLTSP